MGILGILGGKGWEKVQGLTVMQRRPDNGVAMQRAQGTHKCDTLTSEGHNLQAIGLFTQIRSDHIYKLGSTTNLKPQDSRAPTLKAPVLR